MSFSTGGHVPLEADKGPHASERVNVRSSVRSSVCSSVRSFVALPSWHRRSPTVSFSSAFSLSSGFFGEPKFPPRRKFISSYARVATAVTYEWHVEGFSRSAGRREDRSARTVGRVSANEHKRDPRKLLYFNLPSDTNATREILNVLFEQILWKHFSPSPFRDTTSEREQIYASTYSYHSRYCTSEWVCVSFSSRFAKDIRPMTYLHD